ncbi:pyridoxal phosphate synthase yaaE subunit [Flavimobilis soli]|uniref:Pyridoxal 5'-phosphate synthase subunit PdxT n=1 Tax=Flavimobilis soli TaxID=442709 RepID=A0A2A9EAJ4_9MICO|nr:pyridoxal 5'-phosphate synthase glutaminase subunit PdxT [Flavimobilis soli]PFG35676.1 pyridoxal phosphate synthase yaaE subunit [Flavimobilis soli]
MRRTDVAAPVSSFVVTTVGVLALQGDVREHRDALEAVGVTTVGVRRIRELEALDGLVIPGGESTTIDKLLGIFELREPLRALLRDGLPAYGSCAGMILLADRVVGGTADQQTLGGIDMTVRRNAFGRQVDSFDTELEMAGVDGPVPASFIRAPWVEEVGPGAQVLSTVTGGPGAGRIVAVRQGALLATSFHPEITGDTRVHEYFVSIVRKER